MPTLKKSDAFLMNCSKYFIWSKKELQERYEYFFSLSKEFFDEWGELWQLEVWSNNSPTNGTTRNLEGPTKITFQFESERGKGFIELPNKGKLELLNLEHMKFPHNIVAEEPFFKITRAKAVRRSKNAMPSVQQDPF